jgi:hypothetical protein
MTRWWAGLPSRRPSFGHNDVNEADRHANRLQPAVLGGRQLLGSLQVHRPACDEAAHDLRQHEEFSSAAERGLGSVGAADEQCVDIESVATTPCRCI